MAGTDRNAGGAARARRSAMLARIASVVGCSVETLQSGAVPEGAAGQAAELLRYWFFIPPEDRSRVLELARSLADQSPLV